VDNIYNLLKKIAKFKDVSFLICDESLFYWEQVRKKQSNKSWVVEVKKVRRVEKLADLVLKNIFTIFFRTSDAAYISLLDKGKTLDQQIVYFKKSIKYLILD
jgi:hypothetical protein